MIRKITIVVYDNKLQPIYKIYIVGLDIVDAKSILKMLGMEFLYITNYICNDDKIFIAATHTTRKK
jgi:hypothetical protein